MEEILKKTVGGQGILKNFNERKVLTEDDRKDLVDLIVNHLLNQNKILGVHTINKYAEEIVKQFPGEIKVSFLEIL